jgi:hypothetical protein
MQLKARLIYTFVRNITNNSSPEKAVELLFQYHPGGGGSGYLEDYLDRPWEVHQSDGSKSP